ncbi:extracellular catalytic domain type 1 short-chain-length polyhydroxyalkanoate depolymerase [Micromonospora carbonacea]|uniref:PHB depolymerase family esterase n=1 Tax=Micromonospora carbonacea TaxID=47853 RepID=A0A7H8XIL7_9ACTN|nr:PHB depolymerase family esterase [Micromonospora carbonacea]MBB5827320.1 poly(hydroxyalkanoate) depolymerase family esterase [Micromonospora carbonacea]QLD24903.1 PHB depolymerase family esterase [Micromonospora carbonacea]
MKRRIALLAVALATALATTTAVISAAPPASAATLTQVTNFGTNPTNLQMHLYVPDRVAARPPLLLALHYCTGSGPALHTGYQLSSLADRYGYIVIYPSVTRSSKCWDVSSPQALRRDGGSDPVGLKSMIDYVRARYPVDANRIGVLGFSSGAMMTNVMAGLYPDVFHAGVSSSGVPFGCFATTNGSEWNSECSGGRIVKTPQQWGDLVRNAYPGYTGRRPRMQIWHGTTDTTLSYVNFGEQIKQWTNVLGVSQTPVSTDYPQTSATRTRYGGTGGTPPVEAISFQGYGHSIPFDTAQAIRFLGFDVANPTTPPPTTPPPTTPPPTTPPPTTPPPTTPPPTTPPPGGAGCSATVSANSWTGGFVATVKVTAGSGGTRGWNVSVTLPGGTSVTGTWSATASGSSGTVRFANVDYNGQLAAGQVTEFGFQGNGTAPTQTPTCTAS